MDTNITQNQDSLEFNDKADLSELLKIFKSGSNLPKTMPIPPNYNNKNK